jgi:membrane protease YdiL (CAAX protease family)
MDVQPYASENRKPPETRLSVIIRVVFFLAITLSGLIILEHLLSFLGSVVAGTVGLGATALLANLLTMRIFDRRPLADIGLQGTRASIINFSLGLALGAGAAICMLLAPLLAGTGHLVQNGHSQATTLTLLFYLFTLFVAAMGEELIFRGYAFQLLVEKLGPFATILPVSVLFGVAHAANPHSSRIGVMNTVIWGILLGYGFLRSRDLWLPIGLHYGWNVVLPLFGVNLSGLTIEVTRYSYQWDLLPIWSGGDYGPEGGLLATIFVVALFFALMKSPVRPQIARVAPSINDPFD